MWKQILLIAVVAIVTEAIVARVDALDNIVHP
jgi:hypothetical protein